MIIALLLTANPVHAQQVTTSPAPDQVGVTVYRDPNRAEAQRPNLQWLGGYALITEVRRVRIPAGEVELRFEGVAGGIIPASAIVSGLPDGVGERNRDARLLSPGALVDAYLGRRVTVRRTSIATGQSRELDAVVRSGPDQALVLETAEGIEALRCSGLPEALVFPAVPADLSAKPTLSVRTTAARAWAGEVTLSYLASGFDWTASYVARLAPGGDRMDLFAWVTLANGDETGFSRAETQAVAGRVNREATPRDVGEARSLELRCWPGGTTTDLGELRLFEAGEEEVVVTGSRIRNAALAPPPPVAAEPPAAITAVQEELGDLKLYRIPEPVTVAARSQKQVAMLQRRGVRVTEAFRSRLAAPSLEGQIRTVRLLSARNTVAAGLGLPLPAGRLALFAERAGRPLLVGQGSVDDRAVGEEVEFEAGEVTGIVPVLSLVREGEGPTFVLTVTNDHASSVAYEAEFAFPLLAPDAKLISRGDKAVWRTTIPPNGRAVLRFTHSL